MSNINRNYEFVPPCFSVLVKLCQLLRSDYVDVDEIANLVKVDPGLASSVVSLSNCAYYGFSEPASTIDEAIYRVGFSELIKLVGLVSNLEFSRNSLAAYGMSSDEMWNHSLAVAVMMEFLSYDAKLNPGLSYLIGLLHAIGYYPIADRLAKVNPKAVLHERYDLMQIVRWERDEIGFDHAQAGALMLQRWDFAGEIYNPIAKYLHPLLAGPHKKYASLLNIAVNVLPCVIDRGYEFSDVVLSDSILKTLGVHLEQIEGYIEPARAWIDTTNGIVSEQLLSA